MPGMLSLRACARAAMATRQGLASLLSPTQLSLSSQVRRLFKALVLCERGMHLLQQEDYDFAEAELQLLNLCTDGGWIAANVFCLLPGKAPLSGPWIKISSAARTHHSAADGGPTPELYNDKEGGCCGVQQATTSG